MTSSEHGILKTITLKGPMTGYRLANDKQLSLSDKTCYKVAKKLVEKRMLTVVVVGKSRTNMDKKEYSLTVKGLAYMLHGDDWRDYPLDTICERWNHLLPLVLGKWSVFKVIGLQPRAAATIHHAADRMIMSQGVVWHPILEHPEHYSQEDAFTYLFYDFLISPSGLRPIRYSLPEETHPNVVAGVDREYKKKKNIIQRLVDRDQDIKDYLTRFVSLELDSLKQQMQTFEGIGVVLELN
jgi:DNA-binding PadR family transcriptional regulator